MNTNLTTERPTFVTHLECAMHGDRYEADTLHNLSKAGKPLLVRYDLAGVKKALTKEALKERPDGLWKWRELLPVRKAADIVSLGEVATPLISLPKLARKLGGGEIIVKDEGRLPTGSFKARGLVMAVSMAKALGVKHMAMPTNGNAGAAMAAYASRCGIRTTIFCPEDTPEINLSEIALEGAHVYRVNGLIDDCGKLVGQGREAAGWFDTSTLKEPYRIEGKKTMGLELAEQFGWELPDVIFYPTGGGTGLIGMWKAFAELEAIGFIGSKRPRMVAAQAEGCAPMVRAWEKGEEHAPRFENAHTIASGIRVPQAVGDFLILRAVREFERLCDRGLGRSHPGRRERSRARGGLPDVPRRRRDLCGLQGGARRRAREEDGPLRAVQLRHGTEVPDAEGDGDARPQQADRFCKALTMATRKSIEIEGFTHKNPIPAASRVGNMLMTGIITGTDPATGKLADTLEAQCANIFHHVRSIMAVAGGSTDDIIKMNVWMKDRSNRDVLNAEWVKMFPDPAARPARHTSQTALEGGQLIVCDITAVFTGSRHPAPRRHRESGDPVNSAD